MYPIDWQGPKLRDSARRPRTFGPQSPANGLWGMEGARRSYLRVRNDAIFFEVGEKVASVDLAVVMAEFFLGAACFLVEKGGHSDHWLETHAFAKHVGCRTQIIFQLRFKERVLPS